MRSHGVARFPDPAANGGAGASTAGIVQSAPAVRAAAAACRRLLPEKRTPEQAPTAAAYTRLLHWAVCLRRHGLVALPDPRPDPLPAPGSPAGTRFVTVMGDGGYWVGIPASANPHSPAFIRLSARCGEPTGGPS